MPNELFIEMKTDEILTIIMDKKSTLTFEYMYTEDAVSAFVEMNKAARKIFLSNFYFQKKGTGFSTAFS